MKATFESAVTLKRLIEVISAVQVEVNFDCDAKGISMQSMDGSHVSVVSLALPARFFEEYSCKSSLTIGIHLGSLAKIVKLAGNEDSLTLSAGRDDDKLTVSFGSDQSTSTFYLNQMNIESEKLGVTDHDYDHGYVLPAKKLQELMANLYALGDTVQIECHAKGLRFTIEGEIGNGTVELHCKSTNAGLGETEASFALKHLISFTKATTLAENVAVVLPDEMPIALRYAFGNGAALYYFLAPKIDDDDDDERKADRD